MGGEHSVRRDRQEMEPGFSVPADRGYRSHDRVRSAEGATGATVEDITAVFGYARGRTEDRDNHVRGRWAGGGSRLY